MMARKRAQQRWSALLSRIAKQMRLDAPLWTAFVDHANANYKAKFVAVFGKPVLRCVGPSYGDPCGFCVDLSSWDAVRMLRFRCEPKASHCHKLNMPHYRGLRDVAV